MNQCEFCGRTTGDSAGPHWESPCPVKVVESDARIEAMTGRKLIDDLERQLRLASDPEHIKATLKVIGYTLPELDEIFRQEAEWRRHGGNKSLLDIALAKARDET